MVLISLVDLTERIRAEELLQQLQAEFAHAARVSMLGELTASIAHELKQPLAAIRMNSSLGNRWLDRSEPDIAEARLVNQHITVDAQRAVEIVDRIHAMATRRELKRVAAPLDPLVDEALLFLHHELHKRGIAIVRKRAAGVPVVVVDRVQLQQVVVNLVVNAMQAMEAAAVTGGHITVATHALDTSSVTCSVEDGGPGIDLENVKRVFESFYTTKAGGMGMGLAISRSIIEMHGGTIAADNASAHGGARFFFTLPLATSSAEVDEGAV
jgi:signal transduction histidine kinase